MPAPPPSRRWLALFALAWTAFVVYGSLLPFAPNDLSWAQAWAQFRDIPYLQLGVASRADWVANILLYLPLGFALTGALAARLRGWAPRLAVGALVVLLGFVLAVAVEFTQQFFPPRTVSLNDLIAETIGTVLGVAAWLACGPRLLALWGQFRLGGAQAWPALLALYALAYLALMLFPFDLLVSAPELAAKLANPALVGWGVAGACGSAAGCALRLVVEAAAALPLGALLALLLVRLGLRPRVGVALAAGLALGLAIEAVQLLLASGVSQGVSVLTRALGLAWGLVLQRALIDGGAAAVAAGLDRVERHRGVRRAALLLGVLPYLALLALLNGFTGRLEPGWAAADKLAAMPLVPFHYHYWTSETVALWSLIAHAAVYAVVGFGVWLWAPQRRRLGLAALLALALALAVETFKLFLPGERPDLTHLLLAPVAAALAHAVLAHLWRSARAAAAGGPAPVAATRAAQAARPAARGHRVLPALGAGATLAALALTGLLLASPVERIVDEGTLARLPTGEALPPVVLPGFRTARPRLPHPSAADLVRLRAEGQPWLEEQRRRAARGDLHARTVLAYLEPGSQDLAALHAQLMGLRVQWRGHDQVRPLAQAYDWLHGQWSPLQRTQLRQHLAGGCEHIIGVIRDERLSPYNVILYNAPLQALVACAIALWGDDPRGEPVMRFTRDLWLARVLPVWRQVMGRHGGWHEGGEYVGIGIGGAIYEVPAMWRAATGENLFATEPGLRGFLDFVVHRTRPDGTHMRLGAGSYFDRRVPGALPLAIELRHAAAYTLHAPREVAPSAWPWGPLPDASLLDAQALQRLAPVRHFDGIGVVTSRTAWGDDATYVTFKAGDNFWSHMHLDQGSFTIWRGGPLALDDGLSHAPRFGSDHHLNYAAQTVAHNTITVTDPADTAPMPAHQDNPARPIANDGGQRRAGTGWRLAPAPLDLAEWQAMREVYESGDIVRFDDAQGIALAVADITAAYTNASSAAGSFWHRTRRVERAWRVYAHDRIDDVVVVYDDVVATRPEFRKRWLLHTLMMPRVQGRQFVAEVVPGSGRARRGGRLEGHVLLPRDALLLPIGGRGFEFFVDGVNFDEGGALQEALARPRPNGPEPGRWRLELMPAHDAAEDRFLVVLLPRDHGAAAPHRVRLLEEGGRVGAEVAGPRRTVRYWFRPGTLGAQVEVVGAGTAAR